MASRYIPYSPQNDPQAYLSQALQNYGVTRQKKRERGRERSFIESLVPPDISTINDQRLFSPGGQETLQAALFDDGPATFGQRPGQQTLSPQQLLQSALKTGMSLPKALEILKALRSGTGSGFTLSPGQTRYGPGGQPIARGTPKLTESQQLQTEGYTSEEIRRIRDIKHGIEPRATSRITYDRMTAVEKMKYLSTERTKAEGQYFGSQYGNKEARQPLYRKWVLKEQEKVRQELGYTEVKSGADFTKGVLDRLQSDREPPTVEDKQALEWARSNPTDPRAIKILALYGVE